MHFAGREIQELYETLPTPGDVKDLGRGPYAENFGVELSAYEVAVKTLNSYFLPKVNLTFERHELRKIKQAIGENISMFVLRLRKQAERCGLGQFKEEHIKDVLIENCLSPTLRRKLLFLGDAPLEKVLQEASIFESVQEQTRCIEQKLPKDNVSEVNEVKHIRKWKQECNRCGRVGHYSYDKNCPAEGKKCRKCGGKNHFAQKCRSSTRFQPYAHAKHTSFGSKHWEMCKGRKVREGVKFVAAENKGSKEYVFHVGSDGLSSN